MAAVRPEQLATLIYTSGTTGRPKGVELPHRCWTYIGAGAEAIGSCVSPDDLQYLWLPLSHSFGKMLQAVQLQIGFPTAVDGRVDKIVENLAVVRPTFMAAPPRVFEKVHAKVVQTVEEEGGLKYRLFRLGLRRRRAGLRGLGSRAVARARCCTRSTRWPTGWCCRRSASRLGGRIRFLISGSAALSTGRGRWFHAAGLLVLEGYALTETSAGACIALPQDPVVRRASDPPSSAPRCGSRRTARSSSAARASCAATTTCPRRPPRCSTRTAGSPPVTSASSTTRGRLRITDRKKDLIKTSGGKYIAPQAIEVMFKAVCPLASQMLVHADGRNYATALITLDPDALAQWAAAHGLRGDRLRDARRGPRRCRRYVQACVDELNGRLNRWETIKDFRILDHDLAVETDELTPSLKVKRKVIEAKYEAPARLDVRRLSRRVRASPCAGRRGRGSPTAARSAATRRRTRTGGRSRGRAGSGRRTR